MPSWMKITRKQRAIIDERQTLLCWAFVKYLFLLDKTKHTPLSQDVAVAHAITHYNIQEKTSHSNMRLALLISELGTAPILAHLKIRLSAFLTTSRRKFTFNGSSHTSLTPHLPTSPGGGILTWDRGALSQIIDINLISNRREFEQDLLKCQLRAHLFSELGFHPMFTSVSWLACPPV